MHSSFLPMVLIMLYQILSFKLFENVLFDEEDDIETTRLSIFPAAIGLLACIPVLIAYFVIVQWWFWMEGSSLRRNRTDIIPTYPCGRYIYSLQTQLRVVGEKTSLGCNTFLHHIYHWSFDSNLGSYPYALQVAVGNHLIHGRLHCSCSIMQATPLPWQ